MQKSFRLTPNEQDILIILVYSVNSIYGLEIFDQINKNREDYDYNKIGYGSFYAALKKLEREKLIKSSTPEDKRKKYYEITAEGKQALNKSILYNNSICPKPEEII